LAITSLVAAILGWVVFMLGVRFVISEFGGRGIPPHFVQHVGIVAAGTILLATLGIAAGILAVRRQTRMAVLAALGIAFSLPLVLPAVLGAWIVLDTWLRDH
jgi:hypothetical protein